MGGSIPLQLSYPLFCSAAAAADSRRFLRINGAPHQKHTACRRLICAATDAMSGSAVAPVAAAEEEPPSIDFAFVSPRLLPDGTPDIQIRSASGGQKLRDVMLDGRIDLYGPYDAPLSNCSGFGTCGTCLVEVVEGKELLSPRTEKEKETLKKKPKTWRLACQTTVGRDKDSRGQVVIQQLPEWKEKVMLLHWTLSWRLLLPPKPQLPISPDEGTFHAGSRGLYYLLDLSLHFL